MSDDQPIQPFVTQDFQLALALATAGCQFLPQEHGGPISNVYTPGFLRDRRLMSNNPVSPEEFEEAALVQCVNRNMVGIRTFYFLRTPTFDRAITAHDALVAEMQKAKKLQDDKVTEGFEPKMPDISEEVIMQAAYFLRMNRERIEKLSWARRPEVSLEDTREQKIPLRNVQPGIKEEFKPSPRSKFSGSLTRWTIGASMELREALNESLRKNGQSIRIGITQRVRDHFGIK